MKKLFKAPYLLFALTVILLLVGCSSQLLDQAAGALLQEWQSQQEQSSGDIPDLWTVPPETAASKPSASPSPAVNESEVIFGEEYSNPEDVADYLHLYRELPPNFITKGQARKMGWDASSGNLWKVAPGKSIGGDHFGNYEGKLPEAQGRSWFECDVNYDGGHRGAERILYSNDGLVYYTDDHYNSFTQLY